ncbi:Sec-independent protein translocase subunit TatA/TatB [Mucilaginibacter sp. FT3.2]|uniref:Sec-independent protein translocase subunit TatA/TatB n=1 Tax=Mucilaginibacter sp. FT3.2 TaxID=2723090 RepID=UPI00160C8627|nr:twin-arginine translocase TatA/TatE family subunit [Mucilaginibacter sp. FT3.2]MBB6234452.1 sec-independent protein translocase protein TatA [Mucilaginibacter sp. FT3.2]
MLSTVFLFLNIGTGEMVLILFAALMLFGGEKLPGMARTLGKGIRDFKDASEDVKREINNQINNFQEKPEETKTTAPVVEEHVTPLIEEHSADNTPVAKDVVNFEEHPNPVIAENRVPNTIPVGEFHVSSDDVTLNESKIDLSKH